MTGVNWFKKLIVVNLVLVFVVIAAGAIVRATGSGMGCPDWPKCFGKLIPPTNVDQITWHPNQTFTPGEMIIMSEELLVAQSSFTSSTAFNKSNWSAYEKHDYATFNPLHTWVEFINRLATVVLGFPVMLMLALSFLQKKDKKPKIILSASVVLLIGFQAWLGKIVVDRNLQGTTITYHMIGVFVIIAVLIALYHITKENRESSTADKSYKWAIAGSIFLTLLMVLLGTQVREEIDLIAKASADRSTWIEQLSSIFIYHRSLVWLVVGLNGYIFFKAMKNDWFVKATRNILIVIVVESVVGIIISYFSVPAVSQPIHIFLAALLFAFQVDLYMKVRKPNLDLAAAEL